MDRFCPACGAALGSKVLHGTERQVCGRCGRVHYQNSKPAVGAIAVRQGKVLLSRRARPPHQDFWDLPGGFLEAGEEPLAGLRRELDEETGLKLLRAELHHIGIGDYAGQPTLNLMYVCDVEGEPVANDDSAELRWWSLDALPPNMAWPHEREALARLR